jgi:protein-arginine kinase activator protein McsA
MIICNKCSKHFEDENQLSKILITETGNKEVGELYHGQNFKEGENQEVINGCPNCLTDGYLMDVL